MVWQQATPSRPVQVRHGRKVVTIGIAIAGLAFLAGCGTKQVTDTIYFRSGSPRSAEGALISSLLANPTKPPSPGLQHYQVRGMVPKDTSPPRVVVTFRGGTTRAEVDSFNQPFLSSGLVDHISVQT